MGNYVFSPNGHFGVAARPSATGAVELSVLSLPTLEWRTVSPPVEVAFSVAQPVETGLSLDFDTLAIGDDGTMAFVATRAGASELHVVSADGAALFTAPARGLPAFHPLTGELAFWQSRPTDPYSDLVFADARSGAEKRRVALSVSSSTYQQPGLRFDRISGDALTRTYWLEHSTGAIRPVPFSETARVVAFHDRSVVVIEGNLWSRLTSEGAPVWSTELAGHLAVAREDASVGVSLSFMNADVPGVATLIELTTGKTRLLGEVATKLSASDALYHWPTKGPVVVRARSMVASFDPLETRPLESPLDLVGAARLSTGFVTAHDDGVRWWSRDGVLEHHCARPALSNSLHRCHLEASPNGQRLLVSGRSGVLVFEGRELVWSFDQLRFASWVDDEHVAMATDTPNVIALVALSDRSQQLITTGSGTAWTSLFRAGDQLWATWAGGVEVISARGEVINRWKVAKSVKGYGAVTQVERVGDETWVLSKGRLFSWADGKPERQLADLDKPLGFPKSTDYSGTIFSFAVTAERIALGVNTPRDPKFVTVDRVTGQVLAETAPVPTLSQRAWMSYDGKDLEVFVDGGVMHRFRV